MEELLKTGQDRAGIETGQEQAERVVLVGIFLKGGSEWRVQDSLEELSRLVATAGGEAVERMVISLQSLRPRYLIGSGKAEQLAGLAASSNATTIVFDEELTPVQGRNLERATGCKVVDRTQVILDIFAMHAHTREGVLQVELARLSYLLPRLRRMWTHLERQKGGIGMRGGPGEQQIEVDRRIVMNKMSRARRELEDVKRHRTELRRGRRRHGWASVALVGYTNAGKSTLLNRLTKAEAETQDALFVTLDTTTRKLELPNQQQVLLSDTVGFINKLPHQLVEAFKATLDEVVESDVLIHVADAASGQVDEQIDAVNRVLDELGIGGKTTIMALNKVDCPGGAANAGRLERLHEHAVRISARTGEGEEALLVMVADCLRDAGGEMYLRMPYADSRALATLRGRMVPLEEYAAADACLLRVRMPERHRHVYQQYVIDSNAWKEYTAASQRIPGGHEQ